MIADREPEQRPQSAPDRPCRQPISRQYGTSEYWEYCKNPTALRCPACGDAICPSHYTDHSRVCIGGPL